MFEQLVDDLICKARWVGIYSTPRPYDPETPLEVKIAHYNAELNEAKRKVLEFYNGSQRSDRRS